MILSLICGFFTWAVSVVGSEDLAIDPLSVLVDRDFHRLCWKKINGEQNDTIVIKTLNIPKPIKEFFVKKIDSEIYCVESIDNINLFQIRLPMTTFTKEPKTLHLNFIFGIPLGPPLELIQVRTLSGGIRLEMNQLFVGYTGGKTKCEVLWTCQLKSNKTFGVLEIKDRENIFLPINEGSSFQLYYSCYLLEFFKGSTKFVTLKGIVGDEDSINDLHPVIQMPFRRFIMVTWMHGLDLYRQYYIAVSERSLMREDICIKIFRVFINILPNSTDIKKPDVSYCSNVPMEDLGYRDIGNITNITVILDMVHPLKMYRKHKLAIFWRDSSGNTGNNYIFFDPLPNENSGALTISNPNARPFDVPNIYQNVVSFINKHPYTNETYSIPYSEYYIAESLTTQFGVSHNHNNNISILYSTYQQTVTNRSIFPYFYAIFRKDNTYEIMQLPHSKDNTCGINSQTLHQDGDEPFFIVTWKVSGSPLVIAPAMFGIEIRRDDDETCHSAYLLKCRTCNKSYMEAMKSRAKIIQEKWEKDKCQINYVYDYYDAVNSTIKFRTKIMIHSIRYKARIIPVTYNCNYISIPTSAERITENDQRMKNIIIGLLSTTVAVGTIVILYFRFRKSAGSKPPKVKEDSNTYEEDET